MTAAVIQLVALMAVFTIIEGRWPSSSGHKWWRRPLFVDLCGWMVHPLSVSAGITLAAWASNGLMKGLHDSNHWPILYEVRAHLGAAASLAQMAVAFMVADFLDYWIHRAYHSVPVLWAFHVVHHTSEELDWLSTSRLHPISQILNTAMVGFVLLFAGLPMSAVIVANVLTGAAALLVHANVRWTFGPFQYLFVSPLLHQWHHARPDEKVDVHHIGNYGAVLSVWDRMFGTWFLPALDRPVRFGTGDVTPKTVPGLIFYPLRVCLRFFSNNRRSVRAKANERAVGQASTT